MADDDFRSLMLAEFGSVKSPIASPKKVFLLTANDLDKAALLLINHKGWLTAVTLKEVVDP